MTTQHHPSKKKDAANGDFTKICFLVNENETTPTIKSDPGVGQAISR
jgi:hypothetical protein